ncbi:hypothetical protein P5663_06075 [Priestia flexa]|uniref:hypothetical protein n=1 Tax=Priestia flexa TaxID=86664 RepID=UPI00240D64AA|nr:hypothetical protein [Priestia flexa]WEZ09421.1 hypothetical protein P5663_06075 [Priestia flexa]
MIKNHKNTAIYHAYHEGTLFFISGLRYNELFSAQQLLFHGGFLLVAMLGGVIGVNLSGSRTA